jgi:hypothetical protein
LLKKKKLRHHPSWFNKQTNMGRKPSWKCGNSTLFKYPILQSSLWRGPCSLFSMVSFIFPGIAWCAAEVLILNWPYSLQRVSNQLPTDQGYVCRKPQGGVIPKMHGVYDKVVAKWGPTFWGYRPPVGFTNHKAQGKSYHEPLYIGTPMRA